MKWVIGQHCRSPTEGCNVAITTMAVETELAAFGKSMDDCAAFNGTTVAAPLKTCRLPTT